ncbi:type II toxin-antitoxin system death-on-curing family toxin [Scytonema sp. PCC 10023]|uniref:type II toxin-antitoxin system death-on-curing family toxin n=1 Tax=Scytonema sp. PCC 10023 TaxID=1680591 RepID=UPI0039C62352
MKEPRWVSESAVIAMHEELIAEHGGATAIRDSGLLSASLARAKHLFTYSDSATLFDLAAAYAYGLAKNHAFIDGNKRIPLVVIDVFLRLNGYELIAQEAEAVIKITNLAAGIEEQDSIAAWIGANSQELDLE